MNENFKIQLIHSIKNNFNNNIQLAATMELSKIYKRNEQ